MAWHIVEKLIEQVGQHSTLIGKFWTTFFFVLRFLIVVSIADNIFEDEQEEFVCNTLTPGCRNVCFNEFSPISLIRLWALQVLAVAIPSVIFIVYTAHKLTKIDQAKKLKKKAGEKRKKRAETKRKQKWRDVAGSDPPEYDRIASINTQSKTVELQPKQEEKSAEDSEKKDDKDNPKVVATKLDEDTPPRLFLAYVSQVIFRLVVEIAFTVVQLNIYVFKFYIPELFKCSKWPCPNVVDCFVSRPKEKTVMIWVMFGTSLIMIIVGVLELYHLGFTKIFEAWRRRHQDITKEYKVASSSMPQFVKGHGYARYRGGYPQAVGIRVGYARSSISGGDGGGYQMDQFI